jgi:hypothetical protein
MEDTVTSKFTTKFWLKAVVFTLFVFISTLYCIIFSANHKEELNWGQLWSVAIYSVLLAAVYVYISIRSLRKITAARQGIIINYLITKKQIVIDYAYVVHVSNLRVHAADANQGSGYLELAIELNTGEKLILLEEDVANYDELKEAIREFRFKLR